MDRKESLKVEKTALNESMMYNKKPFEYYNYKLKGIVVHRGSADSGHYFSYIQTKDAKNNDRWIEFEDVNIRYSFTLYSRNFNANDIPKECFGGSTGSSSNDDWWSNTKDDSSKSAYILVYERLSKDNLQFEFENKE